MLLRFDVRRVAEGLEGGRSDGADAGEFEVGGQREIQREEVFRGAAAGEGNEVRAFFAQASLAAGEVAGFRHGAVGGGFVHDRAVFGEGGGDDIARAVGPDPEDGLVFDAAGVLDEFLHEGLGDGFLRHEFRAEVIFPELLIRAGSDGDEFRAADVARVFVELEEEIEERGDAVGAGEDDPLVFMRVLDDAPEFHEVGGRLDADGGQLPGIGAEGAQLPGEVAGLLAGARDDDAFSEKRTALEPVQLVAQGDDAADDADGGGFESARGDEFGDGAQRAGEGFLASGGGPSNEGDGRVRRRAVLDEFAGEEGHAAHAHEHDARARRAGELREVERAFLFVRVFVAGEDGELRAVVAVGDGNACIARAGDGGGDAVDDFKRAPGGVQFLRFLAAASKDKGIAAFEARDDFAGFYLFNEQRVDAVLRQRVLGGFLADVDDLGIRARPCEDFFVHQIIVGDDIGDLDALFGAQSDEADVAGAGAGEVTDACHRYLLSEPLRAFSMRTPMASSRLRRALL